MPRSSLAFVSLKMAARELLDAPTAPITLVQTQDDYEVITVDAPNGDTIISGDHPVTDMDACALLAQSQCGSAGDTCLTISAHVWRVSRIAHHALILDAG